MSYQGEVTATLDSASKDHPLGRLVQGASCFGTESKVWGNSSEPVLYCQTQLHDQSFNVVLPGFLSRFSKIGQQFTGCRKPSYFGETTQAVLERI